MAESSSKFSLRTILIAASVLQVCFISIMIGGLAWYGGQHAVSTLIDQLLVEIDSRVHGQLDNLLQEAESANAANKAVVASGLIKLDEDARWRDYMWHQKSAFPNIGYFTVAESSGEWCGLKTVGGFSWSDTENTGGLRTYAIKGKGQLGPETARMDEHDANVRDWFRIPAATLKASWSPIYVWSNPEARVLSMTLSQPILDDKGGFSGLVAVDLTLGSIHEYLQGLDVGQSGRAFLIERDGTLIAASADADPFTKAEGAAEPERLKATDYRDKTVSDTAALINHQLGDLTVLFKPQSLRAGQGQNAQRIHISPLGQEAGLDWLLVVVMVEKDFMEEIYASTFKIVVGCILILLLTVLFGVLYSSWISEPLIMLSREVRLIQKFKLDNTFDISTRLVEVERLRDSLTLMQTGLSSFQRFVPADLVRRILELGEEARLGGEIRNVTVLFSDLRGYSTLSETLSPVEVIEFMNTYFQAMQEEIHAHGGVVLELLGDAILAVFGAPDELPEHAEAATQAALAMRVRLKELNVHQDIELGHRIGIHTGQVVAGNIGGHSYMKYGVIGDVVNVAARLEQLNKELETSILISEEVHTTLPSTLRDISTSQGKTKLKGRNQSLSIFSL